MKSSGKYFHERSKVFEYFDIRKHLSHDPSTFPFTRSSISMIEKEKPHTGKKSNLYHTAKVNLSYYQSTRLTEPILLGIYIFLFFFFFSPNFSSEGIRFPVYRGLIKGRCATRNKVHRDRCFVVGQINWNSRPNLLVSNAKREDL